MLLARAYDHSIRLYKLRLFILPEALRQPVVHYIMLYLCMGVFVFSRETSSGVSICMVYIGPPYVSEFYSSSVFACCSAERRDLLLGLQIRCLLTHRYSRP